MKEPTKVKMGIAKTLDKLQALHGMVVAIFRSRSRHTYMRSHCISEGRPVGSDGVFRVASDRVIRRRKLVLLAPCCFSQSQVSPPCKAP